MKYADKALRVGLIDETTRSEVLGKDNNRDRLNQLAKVVKNQKPKLAKERKETARDLEAVIRTGQHVGSLARGCVQVSYREPLTL